MAVMPIRCADIADAVERGLCAALAELDREQAVYGIDTLDEIALHPLLEQSLREADFGVFREQRYPADRGKRRISEGERCDFVLTPNRRELAREYAHGTLFDAADSVSLDEGFWLEVKVVAQFTVEGPNHNWSSQLLSTVRQDITKLSKDPVILHAGLLIILFVRDESVAEHDLRIWQDRCLERGLPIGAPARRTITIADRIGNAICALALYPVGHL
jgi:hypothetical protein